MLPKLQMRYLLRVGKPHRPRRCAAAVAAGLRVRGAGALLPAIRQDERDEREGSEGKRWKGEGQKGRKGKNREDREQTSAFQNPLKTKRAPGEIRTPVDRFRVCSDSRYTTGAGYTTSSNLPVSECVEQGLVYRNPSRPLHLPHHRSSTTPVL